MRARALPPRTPRPREEIVAKHLPCSDDGTNPELEATQQSHHGAKISDLHFTDDAVIFTKTLDILMGGTVHVLNEKSGPLA